MAKRRRLPATSGQPSPAARPSPGRKKAKAATPPRRPRKVDRTVITIRAQIGEPGKEQPFKVTIKDQPDLERIAEEWTYILRSRTRWADDMSIRPLFRDRALDDLDKMGASRADVKLLATTRLVEVELHSWDTTDLAASAVHECAATIPWEYLISCATRGVGRHQSLLVTRLFRNDAPQIVEAPARVLFIESAPGRLEDTYDFESERERIAAAVGADLKDTQSADPRPREMKVSATETIPQLKKRIRSTRWDVLHVTGVDTHQAAWFVEDFYEDLDKQPAAWQRAVNAAGNIRDGMILREPNVAELPVNYEDLATILIDSGHPPALVTLNLYYSGARTARELVRRGARAALGFLDEIDDELAERFFQAFYWEWYRPGGANSTPDAFEKAWRKMKGDRLHGTAIVIWMGRSVFDVPRAAKATLAIAAPPSETRGQLLARLDLTPIGQLLQVQLEVAPEVNYSLLHNDRPLLGKLTLTKLIMDKLEDITVQVELNLGSLNYPYRSTCLELDEPQLALAPVVRIPLTAALPRSLRERVQSTVYVKVTCRGRTAWESTERVTLIPVDEWVDDTDNNPWLPSFVLPRDPAVLKLINSSRRYLIGIRDDPAAGFDGYQAVDPKAKNPTAGVDAQVQAIWTAVVNEYRIQYINPPPAYSDQSQRLRTPTDILASNTGTCIDLALLLASCLEYIDVYPVLVLLTGHAFVGYWRSEEAHDAFVEMLHVPAEVPAAGSPVARSSGVPFVDRYGWRLTRLHYNEIMEYVTSGDLVMLEATFLTSASSFAEAMEEGRANMRSRRQLDSLLDIRLARSATPPVTPLPIIND
jgi:CHAT domain